MGDVKKDVETMRRMHATSDDKLRIMTDLTETVIRVNYERIKKENPQYKKEKVLKKLQQCLFYGRKDNHRY